MVINPTLTNVERRIYAINWLSNCNGGKVFTSQADSDQFAQDQIAAALVNPGITGDNPADTNDGIKKFDVVWGPYTSASQDTTDNNSDAWVTDNSVFVAKQKQDDSTMLYVVGVAGTNANSFQGWFIEDLDVGELATLPWDASSGKIIANGAAAGASKLINLPAEGAHIAPQDGGESISKTLNTDIANLPKSITKVDVAVSGHSLGGALSPVFALYLKSVLTDSRVSVAAYPTAGPSAGTQDYVNLLATLDYKSLWNTKDIVPHAWDHNYIAELDIIYSSEIEAGAITKGCIYWASKQPPSESTYKQADFHFSFSPKLYDLGIYGSIIDSFEKAIADIIAGKKPEEKLPPGLINDLKEIYHACHSGPIGDLGIPEAALRFMKYMAQAGMQHTKAYVSAFFEGFSDSETFIKAITPYVAYTETPTVKLEEESNLMDFLDIVADYLRTHGPSDKDCSCKVSK